jgi:hypothetical protein
MGWRAKWPQRGEGDSRGAELIHRPLSPLRGGLAVLLVVDSLGFMLTTGT